MSKAPHFLLLVVWLLMGQMVTAEEAQSGVVIPPSRPLPKGVSYVTPEEAQVLIEIYKGLKIIDVRSKEEQLEQGQIEGAQHLDAMRGDFSEQFPSIAGDIKKACLIYCSLGGRSQRAAEKAAALGYKDVRILKGGFLAWKQEGKPIIKR